MICYRNIRIALFTFALGVAVVGFLNWATQVESIVSVDLPQASFSILEVAVAPPLSGIEEVGHGCGGRNRYGAETAITGYRLGDFSRMVSLYSEGYDTKFGAVKEIHQRVRGASFVLEDSGVMGQKRLSRRIVLSTVELDKETIDIIRYEGGDGIEVISAKNLKDALEFEKWYEAKFNRPFVSR